MLSLTVFFSTSGNAVYAGRISLKVINRYVQATGGFLPFGGLILIFVLQEAARIAATVWLSVWTSSNDATGEMHE